MTTVYREDGAALSVATVYAIGRNYAKHVSELGNVRPDEPVVFLKARTTVRGLEPAPMAFPDETFDHETELVLRIGRPVPLGADPGWGAIDGLTVGLDVTRRAVQARCKERRLPWTPAKSFQGAAVVPPLVARDALGDPDGLTFALEVGGEPRQRGAVGDMLFAVPELVRHLASLCPLEAGDLVFTGTPEGVGPLRVGDRFTLTLQGAAGSRSFAGVL